MSVGTLFALAAVAYYFYMREVWVQFGALPTVYRYIDWSGR